jgi:CheY-like chemotaxis protein
MGSRASRLRVLLVDDNEDTRDMYARYLTSVGMDVRTAEDGVAGIEAARVAAGRDRHGLVHASWRTKGSSRLAPGAAYEVNTIESRPPPLVAGLGRPRGGRF